MEEILTAIQERGWFHARNVLDQAELQSINEFFDRHHSQFTLTTYLRGGEETQDREVRGNKILDTDLSSPPAELQGLVEFMKAYGENLKQAGFTLGDSHMHATYFPVMERFKKHYDGATYKIALIFYVNQEWEPRYGGNLRVFDKEDNLVLDILPEPGSFITFLSREFPHEVRPSKKERRCVAGWYHDRPVNKSRFKTSP